MEILLLDKDCGEVKKTYNYVYSVTASSPKIKGSIIFSLSGYGNSIIVPLPSAITIRY